MERLLQAGLRASMAIPPERRLLAAQSGSDFRGRNTQVKRRNATWALLTASTLAAAGTAAGQGSLIPPGPPGMSMKTLAQLEPRTPIATAPYAITQAGSYYLTTNLSDGITITADNVTLDLMGFALKGPGSGQGIDLQGATNAPIWRVVVRNGLIAGFPTGVRGRCANNCRFETLCIASNTIVGIHLDGAYGRADGNTIENCSITDSGTMGIHLAGAYGSCNGNTIKSCVIARSGWGIYLYGIYGQCDGNAIVDCSVTDHTQYGAYLNGWIGRCNASTVSGCSFSRNGYSGLFLCGQHGECRGSLVSDCTISSNGTRGLYLSGYYSGICDGTKIKSCTISDNKDEGVYLRAEEGRCDGNLLEGCAINGNGSYGIYLYASIGEADGNTISDCAISRNGDYGIYLYGSSGTCDGNTIEACTVRENALRGIFLDRASGNRICDNHVSAQTGGILSAGIYTENCEKNLILRNTCVGQMANFTLDTDDTYGPIVTTAGALSTTGADAHPWANFSR